jgi:hypothetical protein
LNSQNKIKDLGDGLILRRSSPQDAQALGDFNAWIHGNMEENQREEGVGAWTQDLLTKPHPTFHSDDFTIVEDTKSGKLISSLNLISQTWSYEGIHFGVGRPELVGTHPDYRNRGLVRAQFDEIHSWSAERGELVQAITGIPYYYRLFGYEMALNLGGNRTGYLPQIPKLKEDETEPYAIRPAAEEDIDFIAAVYAAGSQRYPVRSIWSKALLQYELNGKSKDNINRSELRVIATVEGEPVGFLAHAPQRWGVTLGAFVYELKEGISWASVTPSVARYLGEAGKSIPPYHGEEPFGAIAFNLGEEHPMYTILGQRLPRVNPPYAWYLRVPDLPGFIRHIAPALEQRLADSLMAGHSGDYKITFYRDGMRLLFEKGKLKTVEAYPPHPVGHSGNAGFPGLTFLQLLFGYRSLADLRYAFADCWTDETLRILLPILFPKRVSDLWPIS